MELLVLAPIASQETDMNEVFIVVTKVILKSVSYHKPT